MSAVRDCPGCGKGFLKGKRVLFPMRDGRLVRKLVCLRCATGAERIITKVTAKPCMIPACPNAAHVCSHHMATEVQEVRNSALHASIVAVSAKIKALCLVQSPNPEHADALVEGLQMALEILTGSG